MPRTKKILNLSESTTREILSTAAARNGVRVVEKVRVADVLQIEGSGISDALYSYALRAHFDFIVVNDAHESLFAVEFDGPGHRDADARVADRKKNELCEAMEFPLARVRDEHVFGNARGIDYLTWLTEVYFAYEALARAQESGHFPQDEPLDPMMFIKIPALRGRFPLFISAEARVILRRLHDAGAVTSIVPDHYRGYASDGSAAALNAVATPDASVILSTSAIYLSRFSLLASEAAEEIGTVKLVNTVVEHQRVGGLSVDPLLARERLIDFIREYRVSGFGGGSGGLPSPLSYSPGVSGERWVFGGFRVAPEVVIRK